MSIFMKSLRDLPSLSKPCNTADVTVSRTDCLNRGQAVVNHGYNCNLVGEYGNVTGVITCRNGAWIALPSGSLRLKRQAANPKGPRQPGDLMLQTAGVGASIGATFGPVGMAVGAVVGAVGGLICEIFCHHSDPPPPNQPPTIHWAIPNKKIYHAESGHVYAVAIWPKPSATDPEDGTVRVELVLGSESGSRFSRGSNTIIYQAKDSGGLIDSKYYTFKVEVTTCKAPLARPSHGLVQCENPERIAGSNCSYSCFEGFRLNGDAIRRCEENGSFSGHDAQCKDAEPPEIKDCPTSINTYAERGQSFAIVTWNTPTGIDNSGGNVTIQQTVGEVAGSRFDVGFHEIRYLATDLTGNKSPDCIFFVIVEKLLCDPPAIVDPFMKLTCPDGFIYGSSCSLSCKGSYPLIGNDKMYCDRNSTNSKFTYWNWGSGPKPYCKQNNCPSLVPPVHGALTCDKWAYGTQCMLHCNEHYDIPAAAGGGSVARFTGQFTCSTSSGKWSPVESVPGCSVKRDPVNFVLPSEMYYYSGTCDNKTTQDTIKAHFIKEIQALQLDPGWQGICPNTQDCNVQNVDISCGTVRRRRGSLYIRRRRQTQQASILLTFDINLQWRALGNSSLDNYQRFDNLSKILGSFIEEKARLGKLDVQNVSLDTASLQFGQLGIQCEPGRYPRISTVSCASCPLGSTYVPAARKCSLCPKGMYREDDADVTCLPCPTGMSTHANGTVNSTDCRPICKKGHYSLDGVEPCTPCSRMEYGPITMATKCVKCGKAMMTNSSASTEASDCLAFDVAIHGGTSLTTVGRVSNNIVSFTLTSWVKISKFDDTILQLSVKKGAQEILIEIGQRINVSLHSSLQSSGDLLEKGTWQHVAVVWDATSTTLKFYVQGTEQFSAHVTSVATGMTTTPAGSDLSLSCKGPSSSVAHFSGLLLKASVLSNTNIKTLATTCYTNESGDFDMANVLETRVDGLDLVTPSTCDAKDNCRPDPCNGHKCVDGSNTFICHCTGGYTGSTCQIPPDFCKNHKCEHGATCNNMQTNYTCSCMTGFKGQFCESKIVDGRFGHWGEWSTCSKSCAGGMMVRKRECDSPAPDPEGKPCSGQATETGSCKPNPCPVCPHTPRSYGTKMSCNRSSDMITCSASCRDGMWFTPGFTPLDVYKCGKETAYQWNGKPPSCSRVYSPELLETSTTIQYSSSTPCREPEKIKDALIQKTKSNLQCSQNQTCEISVNIEGCSGDRTKRSLSGVKAIITLQVPLVKGDNLNMENFVQTNAVSPAMLKLLKSVADLETSVQQLNTTSDILKFNVDGNVYDVLAVRSTSSVTCEKGKVRLEALCVDCPQGTYSAGRESCLPCAYGTYQDETGAQSCKKCPNGISTAFIGSVAEADCSDDDGDNSLGIIIGCSVAAVVLCGIILGIGIRYHLRSKARNSKMGSFASMNMVQSARPPQNTFLT
ncbi:uncharacterized protein LOC132543964 [Ylistrum balloti]|uniref:uncharacterized protein LOC132543964 n=1 Tax=Ylistrum balloti TaxID=509963 RepID=UPI0029058076|nr:uncharacterized protein LOC132543964 [Ylistrum balloti]